MISSMTAFARKTKDANWGSLVWEVRSVNHRYLEISVRLPEPLRDLEKAVRDQIQKQLYRGKVEAQLKFQPGQDMPFEIVVNEKLARQLASAATPLQQLFSNTQLNTMDLLSWPGILQTKETQMEVVGQAAIVLLKETLAAIVEIRQREGEGIKQYIEKRLANIQKYVDEIKPRMPAALELAREKIISRFEELAVSLDNERLEQEIVWLVNKVDIGEEIQRLEAHAQEVHRVLARDEAVGRRLDFLMQELNREANTLGSKSSDSEITQSVVEIKVQIEQMREQVQNIE